jgi:hypothetical protein
MSIYPSVHNASLDYCVFLKIVSAVVEVEFYVVFVV